MRLNNCQIRQDFEIYNKFYENGGRLTAASGSELHEKLNHLADSPLPLIVDTDYALPIKDRGGQIVKNENGSEVYGFRLNNTGKDLLAFEKTRRNPICQSVNDVEVFLGMAPITNFIHYFYRSRLG